MRQARGVFQHDHVMHALNRTWTTMTNSTLVACRLCSLEPTHRLPLLVPSHRTSRSLTSTYSTLIKIQVNRVFSKSKGPVHSPLNGGTYTYSNQILYNSFQVTSAFNFNYQCRRLRISTVRNARQLRQRCVPHFMVQRRFRLCPRLPLLQG